MSETQEEYQARVMERDEKFKARMKEDECFRERILRDANVRYSPEIPEPNLDVNLESFSSKINQVLQMIKQNEETEKSLNNYKYRNDFLRLEFNKNSVSDKIRICNIARKFHLEANDFHK